LYFAILNKYLMDKCFVIQPFDKGKYDRRYEDTFEPAIRSANLEPYRVDKDPAVVIPIEQIEEGIRKSKICFAEITTDNPNVWYELGFAFASRKDVVMVCEERPTAFPFDIQHKHVIKYKTESAGDFKKLESRITEKLVALLKKEEKVQEFIESPIRADNEGLAQHEVAMLFLILENQPLAENTVSVYTLQSDMEKIGYTKVAANIAFRELFRKGYIDAFTEEDYDNRSYGVCKLTQRGEAWIMKNQDRVELRIGVRPQSQEDEFELPF